MTPTELLNQLRALDIHVRVEAGRLRVNAPKGRMTPELEAALVAGKEELLRELSAAQAPPLTPTPRAASQLPLSFFQERLWVLHRLEPELTTYNFGSSFRPSEAIDAQRLEAALRRVVAKHEILRSRFALDGDAPVARVSPPETTHIGHTDLRGLAEGERDAALDRALSEAIRTPFDLSSDSPVRFQIFRTAEERAALLVSAHHIALDAWSFALLVRDVQAEYAAIAEGRPAAPPPALQYADFARWQRKLSEHPSGVARLAYWKQRLAGLPNVSMFPRDHAFAEGVSSAATHEFHWPEPLYNAVRALARESSTTLYTVLLAAFAAVLHRHTGQTDLALGSPLGTREQEALEGMIGPILNPIVLRFDVADDPSFGTLIERAREAFLEGHANQEVPFERVVQAVNPERSLQHSPLFQMAVVQHNAPDAGVIRISSGGALYDLTLFVTEREGRLTGSYEYRADVYEAATVRRIAGHVEQLLAGAAADRSLRISELPLLGADERAELVDRFNDTKRDVNRATLVAQFARAAAENPSATAVVASDRTLTYSALDDLTNQLALRLRAGGAAAGKFVALATDRSSALPIGLLAILKSGAAYVPVDPTYPAERIALMLRDSGAQQVITTRAMLPILAKTGVAAALLVVDDPAQAEAAPVSRSLVPPNPEDVAYLIYTSGSTGTPKGVLIPHSAVSNFLSAMRGCVGFGARDVLLSVTSPSFDISVLELFLPLVLGARVVLADREVVSDGARLAALVASSGATLLQSTPSGWRLLMNANWPGNPELTAIVGGEPLPPALAAWLRPRVRTLWNAYGPTETTVWSTMAEVEDGPISIGKPIANTRIYVLGAQQRLAPIGALGEICIAGDGVALGYHQRPELTAERFIEEPNAPGKRMYRTGDLGRWRADGQLEHLGRLDGQVKVRGYRIETGEVEAVLASHPSVKQAVVDVRSVAADDPRIVAWIQLRESEDCTGSELRRFLRQRLPEFMIPAIFSLVDKFPLTPNGKVDRRALPDAFASESSPHADSRPPSTPTERAIADIWMRLLNVKRVTLADTFFDLGGHSLLAMRAAHELATHAGRPIDPRLLFFRTLGQLAEVCDGLHSGAPPAR
ncbi:MAG: amino acid adenylation domain-containing protein [Pseudomonadota bacterium]